MDQNPPQLARRRERTNGLIAATLIGMILLGVVYAFWSTTRLLAALRMVDHTREARLELEHAAAEIVDAETAEGGYLLTGDESFLATFEPSLQSVQRSLESVRRLTADNSEQQKQLDRLIPLREQRVAQLREQMKVRQSGGLEASIALVGTPETRGVVKEIRGMIRQMEDTEELLLEQRSLAARNASRITLMVVATGSAIIITLVGIAMRLTRRELATRKQAAQVQQTARDYAQSIVDTVREPLLVLDRELRIERANRAFYQCFHTTSAETEQQLLAAIGYGQWNGERLSDLLKETLSLDKRVDNLEWAYELPGNGSRTMLFNGCKLYRPGNHTEAVLLAIDDITERKQAEQALRASEERFRLIIESVPDFAIFMLDPEGQVTTWNRGAERNKGYKAEEIIGRHFSRFYPPEDIAAGKPERALAEAREKGRVEDEGWRVRKDGTRFFVNVIISAIRDEQGQLKGFTKITRDITERHRSEQQVQAANDQLRAANAELEAFSYSVSHDLRAPLRHIDGFADLLGNHGGASLDDKARRYLKTISDSAKRMGALIDDLLVFSRIGRAEMRRTKVDLNALTEEVIQDLRVEAGGRNVVWKRHTLPIVDGDPALLRQVLVNLLSNAAKYTRPRDPATIELGSMRSPNEDTIFVRDNGVGFDMAYVGRLFGVFQPLHRADEFEGAGIGLANVQRIILRHGGRVWAEGKLGEGATFFFSLPAAAGSKLCVSQLVN